MRKFILEKLVQFGYESEWSSWSVGISCSGPSFECWVVHAGLFKVSLHEWLLSNNFVLNSLAKRTECAVGVVDLRVIVANN